MSYTLEEFYRDVKTSLLNQPGPAGRDEAVKHLEKLLKDEAFLAAYCGPDAKPGIQTIYRDPDAGFNVLVHVYEKGKSGPPHDHGKSWAIYGQAVGDTVMTKWKRVDDASKPGHAEVVEDGSFTLKPGMAGKFEPGDIHSIQICDNSRFLRVTGTDLNTIETAVFNPEQQTVAAGNRL